MSQGRAKQSPWRDILKEVDAQRTLLNSLLHPEQTSTKTHKNISFSTPPSPSTHDTDVSEAQRRKTSVGPHIGGQRALLSPSLEATAVEGRATAPRTFELADTRDHQQAETVASHRSVTAGDGNYKVVEELLEALSTSSWSSESRGVSPYPLDEGALAARSPEMSERDAFRKVISAAKMDSSEMMGVQDKALRSALFYLRATQIVAGEFEERQRVFFDEFTTVTELVSLFVCHMPQVAAKKTSFS